ncbi:MAG TPA: hypothetical protein VFI96_08485, partial [Longimicrobiaceae bacterium]|nr:hypothetical protein [Longimicrobiaceae bacterium]
MSHAPEPILRLTGTRVAEYFRFGCERQLRQEMAPASERSSRSGPRPGAGLLVAAGRAWERKKLRQLVHRLGEERVAGDGQERLPCARVVELLRDPGQAEVLLQPELRLAAPEPFARRFGLDPDRIAIAAAVPDLIRVRRLRSGRVLFQIVDIKASAEARVSHYAQVAYYSLVLEELCRSSGIASGEVDVRWGRIWSRESAAPKRFPLGAYRHHVARLLRERVARVSTLAPEECAWHLAPKCAGCPYFESCRAEADATDNLARVPGITPTAKEVLASRGIRTVHALAKSFRKDTYQGCHALESQTERLQKRTQALQYGKVFDVEQRTHLMPPSEDVRVVLSAESDPVSGLCFALGARVEARGPLAHLAGEAVWLCEHDSRAAERAMLDALLARLDGVLTGVAG